MHFPLFCHFFYGCYVQTYIIKYQQFLNFYLIHNNQIFVVKFDKGQMRHTTLPRINPLGTGPKSQESNEFL